jgi:hypothetical protein
VSRYRVRFFAPLLALGACTSNSTGGNPETAGNDSAVGEPADGAGSVPPSDAGTSAQHDAQGTRDASNDAMADATTDVGVPATGTGPAGTSGVNTYCGELCMHEQKCAFIDAGSATLDSCQAGFQSFYEMAGANPWSGNPPLELYRADYLSALGSCIANASCSESLQASESRCNAALVAGVDGGAPAIVATSEVAAVCRAFQASPCIAADAGTQNCAATMTLFNDQALKAAAACFANSSPCTTVNSCFVAAFTQP